MAPVYTTVVSTVMVLCHAQGVAVFPQGGNTSSCLGAVPDEDSRSVVLSLRRMNRILACDPDDRSPIVEACCILAEVQVAARVISQYFPLSLGTKTSCQIGGNVATNAGGTGIVCYGRCPRPH